jgi:hypothetical protein
MNKFDQHAALEIASREIPQGLVIDDKHVRESQCGWFFPYRSSGEPVVGSNGVVVNKRTGKTLQLGSAYPIERDLNLYDLGYQFDRYDLVVTAVTDTDKTINTLEQLAISVVEPTYEHGTVWRIPRCLTSDELREKLRHLPTVFGDLSLYFHLEALEHARASRTFEFELFECAYSCRKHASP